MHKKLFSHLAWILIASLIGIGICYVAVEGGKIALGSVYDETYESIQIASAPQNIPILIQKEKIAAANPEKPADPDVSIGFVGDITPALSISPDILYEVIQYTGGPNIMIGNLEGVVANNTYLKCKPDRADCFSFNGDDKFLNLLWEASFDVLNVANNHFNDYGQIGQDITLKEIEKAGMIASGMKNEITYLTKNDIKIGIIGFSTYPWTTDMNNEKNLAKIVSIAKENADIVIVIFHGGGEGVKYGHTPNETEWYLGENRGDVRSFSHNAIDAGADMVLGSGPHVLRGIEWYKDKLIAYSLGNFSSTNALSTSGAMKTSAMIEVTFQKDGSLASGTIFPFKIDGNGATHPDQTNTAISAINDLSKSDFGKLGVVLDPQGEIQMK